MVGPQPLIFADLRGGRNGVDPPYALRETECAEALNVDWTGATLGRKRGGADSLSMTGSTMTGKVSFLGRHVPSTDETLAELFAMDDAATPILNRLAGGATWAAPTLKDNPTGNGWDVSIASLNSLAFLAYKNAANRMPAWDGSTVRRASFPVTSAPTVANTGAGTYAATPRYYRQRSTKQSAGITVKRSEPSANVSFTPSGGGTAARVTRASLPGEDETHWELEVSLDNSGWFLLSTIVSGTSTYDDSAAVTSYSSGTASAALGIYTQLPNARFVAADQGRLLMFGSYLSTDKQNDIMLSAVVGSLNVGDAERMDTTTGYRIGLDEKNSGPPTGLVGPVNGKFFAFTYRTVWQLTPSGIDAFPYQKLKISPWVGAVGPKAIVVGEDEYGRPAIYFMSHRGPYRWGVRGLEYLGRGVEDLILRGAPNSISVMNLAATKVVCHASYHADLRQVWFWIATGSSNDPDTKLMWQIGRVAGPSASDHPVASGWARHTSDSASARCSVMFSRSVGAAMSLDLKPYIGQTGANNRIYVCDSTTTTDAGTAFQSYVTSGAKAPWGLGYNGTVTRAILLGKVGAGVTITQTLTPDFGLDTARTSTIDLTAKASETRTQQKFEDASLGDIGFLQAQWGDASAVAGSWSLDACLIDWDRHEKR